MTCSLQKWRCESFEEISVLVALQVSINNMQTMGFVHVNARKVGPRVNFDSLDNGSVETL
jgi:hypothetical protein